MGGRGAISASHFDNIRIMANLGARYYFPDKVKDIDGVLRPLKIASEVTGVKAIAGAGTKTKLRDAQRLASEHHGSKPSEWRKMRGTALVDFAGVDVKAELHWYNRVGDIQVYEVKIKRYLL